MGCASSTPAADHGMAMKPILPPGHPILAGLAQALYDEYCRHPSSPAVGNWWDRLDKGPLRATGVSEEAFETWMENAEEVIKGGTSLNQLKAAWGVQQMASQQPMQMGQPMQMAGAMPVVSPQVVTPMMQQPAMATAVAQPMGQPMMMGGAVPMGQPTMGQPGMATAVAQPMGAPCAPSSLSYAQPGTGQPVLVQGVPTA